MEATGSVPHEQVLRGVRAQALLRGAAGRRPGRGAGHRAAEGALRRGARQRAALLGQPREPRRLLRVLPAGRHHHGPRPRPPAATSRTATRCRSRASTSRACSTACGGTTTASTWTRCATSRASTARSSSGAARRPTRARSTSRRSAPSPTRSGRILVADIAHISGLVCAGVHPSPVGIADVVTSTTHKTFRGPRGGMIFCKKEHAAAIDRAVFPGLQGGPHNHVTAAIAVAAHEAARPEFKTYARSVVENAQALGAALGEQGLRRRHGRDGQPPAARRRDEQGRGRQAARRRRSTARASSSTTTPSRSTRASRSIRRACASARPSVTTRGMGKDAMAQDRRLDRPRDAGARATRRGSRRSRAR